MRVTCPNCEAAYEVPERLLGGKPRALRCARCGTVFEAAAPAAAPATAPAPLAPLPVAAPPPPAVLPPPPPPRAPAPPEPEASFADPSDPPAALRAPAERPGLAPMVAWGVSILLVAGGAIGVLAQRAAIVEAWPPAARFFGWLGLG